MMQRDQIRHIVIVAGIALSIAASIAFVGKKTDERLCRAIVVNIDDQLHNYFLVERDIIRWITNDGDDRVVGEKLYRINTGRLERSLRRHRYVRDAQVFKDLSGNLIVKVDQMRPIARLTAAHVRDRYVSETGEIIPVSDRYTARVVLVRGHVARSSTGEHLEDMPGGQDLLRFLQYIRDDPFWRAQVAEVHMDRSRNITMYSQVSKQKVLFGKPTALEEKFTKLKIFYKRILPAKGWNTYETVNLRFRNQIICE